MYKVKVATVMVLILILVVSIPITASAQSETVTISYDSIAIFIDAKEIIPKDPNGNVVEPFIINGTTYLPVRAVGEAFDKEVGWDSSTKSVFVGKRPAMYENKMQGMIKTVMGNTGSDTLKMSYNSIQIFIDGVKLEPKDPNGKEVEPFIINGTTYLPVRAVGEAFGKDVTWDGTAKRVMIQSRISVPEQVKYTKENPAPMGVKQSYKMSEFNDELCTVEITKVDQVVGRYTYVEYNISANILFSDFNESNSFFNFYFFTDSGPIDGFLSNGIGILEGTLLNAEATAELSDYGSAKITKISFGDSVDAEDAIWFSLTK